MEEPCREATIYLYTAATISVLANGTLLLLLAHQSSSTLGNYRILLGSFAITDILISLFHAWYIPIILLGEYGYIFFGYSTLQKRGSIASGVNTVYATIFFLPFSLLCLHFIYRYLSIARPTLVKERFNIFLLLGISYDVWYSASTYAISYYASSTPLPCRLRAIMIEYAPGNASTLNVMTLDYLDGNQQLNMNQLMIILIAGVLGGHTVLISIICIRKINQVFANIRMLDVRARQMHLQLFRALLIQFMIPVIFAYIPMSALLLIPTTGVSLEQLGNFISLSMSAFPALDPILVILSLGRQIPHDASSMGRCHHGQDWEEK